MMTYLIVYTIFYLINLFSLYYLFKNTFDDKITIKSLPYAIYYINKFSKLKYLYYGLILNLVGTPPFLMFFIKFNLLIGVLSKVSFFSIYIIFLILFMNMIFYIQGLYLKNINFDLRKLKIKKKKIKFNDIYLIVFFLIISYFSVFVFIDGYISVITAI